MQEFLLIFRKDYTNKETQASPDQVQQSVKAWQDWLGGIAALDKLARPPQRWDTEGRVVLRNKTVVNGPFVEIKESIGGMIFVKAKDYDEAVELAQGCPILPLGGNVEIRMAVTPDSK